MRTPRRLSKVFQRLAKARFLNYGALWHGTLFEDLLALSRTILPDRFQLK